MRTTTRVSIALFSTLPLCGCTGSPTLNVFGSFFPSWLLCAMGGIVFALVMHRVFVATGIGPSIPVPALVYLCLAIAFTFALWLIWLA